MFFKKDYTMEFEMFDGYFVACASALYDILSDYAKKGEIGFLIYPLMYVIADLACWNTKFKGKKEVKKIEKEFLTNYAKDTGKGEEYVKMKMDYNNAVGLGRMPEITHVQPEDLIEGYENMLLRGALLLTHILYKGDFLKEKDDDFLTEEKNYANLTNMIYMVLYKYYESLYSLFSTN